MQAQFSKIRERLNKIISREKLQQNVKRRRLDILTSSKHVPLQLLPTILHSETWARELRSSLLPWILSGDIRKESDLDIQMRNIAWPLETNLGTPNRDPKTELSYRIYRCADEIDWDKLELIYQTKKDGIVLKNAILHQS